MRLTRKPGKINKAPVIAHQTAKQSFKINLEAGPLKKSNKIEHCMYILGFNSMLYSVSMDWCSRKTEALLLNAK